MSEATETPETKEQIPSEIDSLKQRADTMGIKYSPNIGLDTLRERVNGKINGTETDDKPAEKKVIPAGPPKKQRTEQQKKMAYQQRLRKESLRLVRVVIQCMNPNKRDSEGEIFTIGNALIGTVKKFVPFNIEAGYHIPHIIYEMMRDRKYQHFVKKKLPNGQIQMISTMSDEFAIKILKPLNQQEMKELKERQALNHSIDT